MNPKWKKNSKPPARSKPKGQRRQQQRKPRQLVPGGGRMRKAGGGASGAISKYAAAFMYPFSKQAEGARVPEPFSVASSVDKAHGVFTLGTTAGSGQSFDAVFTPHLLQSAHSGIGALAGGFAAYTVNGDGVFTAPSGVTVRAAATDSGIKARYKSYRIVSWGIRIKPNVAPLYASGRIYVAVVPATNQVPLIYDVGTTKANWYANLDAPYDTTNGGLPSTLLMLPKSRQFSMSELIATGGVEITLPLSSPAAKTFLESDNQGTEQNMFVNSTTGSTVVGISSNYGSCSGHSQVYIYGEGIGTSGTATDAISVDYIYHIEYIQNISNNSTGLVAAGMTTAPPASPAAEHAVHAQVSQKPTFQGIMDKAKEEAMVFAGKNIGKLVMSAGDKLLGLAELAL